MKDLQNFAYAESENISNHHLTRVSVPKNSAAMPYQKSLFTWLVACRVV